MSKELTRDGKTPETALEPFVQVDMTLHEYERYRDLLEREHFTFCAFCGGKFPGEGTTEDLQAHMNICEQHPMAAQRATIRQLEAQLKSARHDAVRAFVHGEDKLCLVCGAKEPCELKDDPASPCTFEPTPIELLAKVRDISVEKQQMEALVKALEEDSEEYRQYAMEEVRKACQEAGVVVAAEDSICISKAGDIAMRVKQLEVELKEWRNGNGGIVKPPLDPAPDSC
jgi:hypothetical protein